MTDLPEPSPRPLPPAREPLPEPGEVHVWRVELPAVERRPAARRALREILAAYLGGAPEDFALTAGERGRPELAEAPPQLSFNLSHSGGLALVAVALGPVGVDLERVKPRRDLVRLATRWLPPADAAAIDAAPEGDRDDAFYAAWTRHEARAKCTGAGLSGPPPGSDVRAWPLAIEDGYAAAVALDGLREPRITIRTT
jgi:4'-phosphopantetheinyl transferase